MSLVDQITEEIDRLEQQLAALRQARAALQGAPEGSAPARRATPKRKAAKPRSGEQRRPPSGGKKPRVGAEIQRRLKAGEGVKAIAKALRCSASTVSYHAKKLGLGKAA